MASSTAVNSRPSITSQGLGLRVKAWLYVRVHVCPCVYAFMCVFVLSQGSLFTSHQSQCKVNTPPPPFSVCHTPALPV